MRLAQLVAPVVLLLGLGTPVFAGDGPFERLRERIRNLSPEERQRAKERLKERWENMTPEQRERVKERLKEHWDNLTPEQREKIKEWVRAALEK